MARVLGTFEACDGFRYGRPEVAEKTFKAISDGQFYIYSHPAALGNVQERMEDIIMQRNPGDPYKAAPHIRDMLRAKLKSA